MDEMRIGMIGLYTKCIRAVYFETDGTTYLAIETGSLDDKEVGSRES